MALINFFYGNGVPCDMAVQIFRVCNYKANERLVVHFYYYYHTWQNSEDDVHLGINYNMQVQKHIYINGSRKKQLEIVDFLTDNESVGFGNMYTKAIKHKIEHIRTNVCYYE